MVGGAHPTVKSQELRASMKRRPSRHSPIGLDMGETGVRAVQLTARHDRYTVTAAARCDRHRSDTDDSSVVEALARSIRGCLPQAAFRGRGAVTALNPPDVELHALELPHAVLSLEAAEAAEAVHWELQRLVADPKQPVETRHWLLPEAQGPAPNVIGAAASAEAVSTNLAACQRAGLRCLGVDTAITALCRLGGVLGRFNSDEVWGLLDAGDRQTRLVLCLDDVPVLARTTGSGGRAWTNRIADSLGISVRAAEVHKREHGIALSPRGARPCGTGFQPVRNRFHRGADGTQVVEPPASELGSILLGCLRGTLTDLASEVKRSYEYVLSCYRQTGAADLIIVGGGARMRHLPEYLSDALGIPVRRATDYLQEESSRLRCACLPEGSLEAYALAVGLAIV